MMKKCPVCEKPIKLENLERHLKKVHPKEKIDVKFTKKEQKMLEDHDEKIKEFEKPIGLGKIVIVAVAIIIALIAVTVFYPQSPSGYGTIPVGSHIKDFTVTDSNGHQITLSSWEGQVIYLDFIQTGCGHCKRNTQDTLVPLYDKYGSQIKMLSIGINAADNNAALEDFKNNTGASWTFAQDTVGAKSLYGVSATPTGFIINKSGDVAFVHSGETNYNTVSSEISQVLQEISD